MFVQNLQAAFQPDGPSTPRVAPTQDEGANIYELFEQSPQQLCTEVTVNTETSKFHYLLQVCVLVSKIIQSALHLQQHGAQSQVLRNCSPAMPLASADLALQCLVSMYSPANLSITHCILTVGPPWSMSLLLRRTRQDWCTDRPACAFQITSQSRTMPTLPGSRTRRAAHPCLPVSITGWTHASFSSTLTT